MNQTIKQYYSRLRDYQLNGRPKQSATIDTLPDTTCLNCGSHYHGNFCPSCGQSAKTKRFNTRQTIKHLLFTFTKFDDTFWHTTFDLFVRPGFMIHDYLKGHRMEYLKPLQLLVCLITAYILITSVFHISNEPSHIIEASLGEQLRSQLPNDMIRSVYDSIRNAFNNLIINTLFNVTILSFTCYQCFRFIQKGNNLNYAEHFYTHIYTNCIYTMLNLMLIPVCLLISNDGNSNKIGFLVESLIMMLVYAQIFRISWRKAFIAYFFAYIIYLVILIMIFLLTMGVTYGMLASPQN